MAFLNRVTGTPQKSVPMVPQAVRPCWSCRSVCRSVCRLRLVAVPKRGQTGRQKGTVEFHRASHHGSERTSTMKSYVILLLLVACSTAAALTPRGVEASSLRIPATVYPPGAHVGYHPVLTNAEMDCMWGFICEGGGPPNFHFATQDRH